MICHTVVERVGERRAVTGRERGEKAAAEATNKHAMRMVPSELAAEQQATFVQLYFPDLAVVVLANSHPSAAEF